MKLPEYSKYTRLENYFRTVPIEQNELTLSFAEMEAIMHRPLPKSAYERLTWWGNEIGAGLSHKNTWLSVGWEVAEADLAGQSVRFARTYLYPIGNGLIVSWGGSEGEIDLEANKKSLVGNEITRLEIREHRNFSIWRDTLPPHSRQVLEILLDEDANPEVIKLAQESPDEEWEQVQFLRILGGGNPNPVVARMLTDLVLNDILFQIKKSK